MATTGLRRWPVVAVAVLGLTLLVLPSLRDHLNPVEPQAEATVRAAAQALQSHVITSAPVDWALETRHALQVLGQPARRSDLARALDQLVLATGQRHTFHLDAATYQRLLAEDAGERHTLGQLTPEPAGIVRVELHTYPVLNQQVFERDAAHFREQLLGQLRSAPCGVLVDLSRNSGGNFHAMLAALAPLVPDGPLGYHEDRSGARQAITAPDLAPTERAHPRSLALVTGHATGSAGEYLLTALRAGASARSFGQDTAGYTTGNVPFALPHGGMLAVTTSLLLDAKGQVVSGSIRPDQPERDHGAAMAAARVWLRSRCGAAGP